MKTFDLPSPTKGAYQRARNLRNNMTKAEWKLWGTIRNKQLDLRFRRQHPKGLKIIRFNNYEVLTNIDGVIAEIIIIIEEMDKK